MVTPKEGPEVDLKAEGTPKQSRKPARMIAMGRAALIAGFNLIGAESVPDASPKDLESLIAGLLRGKESAIVFVEASLARADGPSLRQARAKGGRIVIVEIPSLDGLESYEPPVEELVRRILGRQALAPSS
ncbi:MAG: V-type ATP synthase subunit F [Acidiferrobacter sp.]